jgi:type VI secretion system protein ImpH
MADDTRHPQPDLTAPGQTPQGQSAQIQSGQGQIAGVRLPPDAEAIGFFELLRQLETGGLRFGRAGGPDREPARLGQGVRLTFATRDIADARAGRGGQPPRIDVNVLGLLGPEGPMPLHLTRWMMTRMSNRWFAGDSADATADTTFLDFVNMLQHRHIALYWRAWADARPAVQVAHGTGGRVSALMRTLAAVGLPGAATGSLARTSAKLRHGTSLAQQVHSPGRLAEYLAEVAGAPVALREFVGRWTDIPAGLQTRLGRAHAALGRGAVAGARVFERANRAEVRLGPLDLKQFTDLIDLADRQAEVRHAIQFAMGEGIAFDLRLVLRAEDVGPARLGTARLGRTAWLSPRPGHDADDLVIRGFTGRDRAGNARSDVRVAA